QAQAECVATGCPFRRRPVFQFCALICSKFRKSWSAQREQLGELRLSEPWRRYESRPSSATLSTLGYAFDGREDRPDLLQLRRVDDSTCLPLYSKRTPSGLASLNCSKPTPEEGLFLTRTGRCGAETWAVWSLTTLALRMPSKKRRRQRWPTSRRFMESKAQQDQMPMQTPRP